MKVSLILQEFYSLIIPVLCNPIKNLEIMNLVLKLHWLCCKCKEAVFSNYAVILTNVIFLKFAIFLNIGINVVMNINHYIEATWRYIFSLNYCLCSL